MRWVLLFCAVMGLLMLVGGPWRSSHATGVHVTAERVTVEIVGNPP